MIVTLKGDRIVQQISVISFQRCFSATPRQVVRSLLVVTKDRIQNDAHPVYRGRSSPLYLAALIRAAMIVLRAALITHLVLFPQGLRSDGNLCEARYPARAAPSNLC